MIQLLLNSIALEPNRWTKDKIAHFSLEQLLDPITRSGFHFVEIWQYHISRASSSEIKKVQTIANSLDLNFPVVGMYPKLHLTGKQWQNEMNDIERIMNYAKQLNTEIIKIFTGVFGSDKITNSQYQKFVIRS